MQRHCHPNSAGLSLSLVFFVSFYSYVSDSFALWSRLHVHPSLPSSEPRSPSLSSSLPAQSVSSASVSSIIPRRGLCPRILSPKSEAMNNEDKIEMRPKHYGQSMLAPSLCAIPVHLRPFCKSQYPCSLPSLPISSPTHISTPRTSTRPLTHELRYIIIEESIIQPFRSCSATTVNAIQTG